MALSDDHGHYNIGYTSSGQTKTPFLDHLAKDQGVILNGHRTYQFCSPTRAALLSGRPPYHVNQFNNAKWGWQGPAIHPGMTTLPEKLGEAGFYTVQLLKWHEGLARPSFTPVGRGFDESLGYLSGGEDHYTQVTQGHVDVYNSTRNCRSCNGTWNARLGADAAIRAIRRLAAGTLRKRDSGEAVDRLMIYLAMQDTHAPEESPARLQDKYPPAWVQGRRQYSGMASAVDETIRNISAALQDTGLWNDTVLAFASDNGGPALVGGPSYANNYPFRGSKGDDFEGGTRTISFVTGGFLPKSARGTEYDGIVSVCDWYATFCSLAGSSNCSDPTTGGLPPSSSVDMWGALTRAAGRSGGAGPGQPRQELVLSYRNFDPNGTCLPGSARTRAPPSDPARRTGHFTTWSTPARLGLPMDEDEPPVSVWEAAERTDALFDAAIIAVRNGTLYKYIQGTQSMSGWWWGPDYPNSTTKVPFAAPGCPSGCLYDLDSDPGEHHDLKSVLPSVFRSLQDRLHELGATCFQSDAGSSSDLKSAEARAVENGGFWEPWL